MSHLAAVFDARGIDDSESLLSRLAAAFAPAQSSRVLKRMDGNFAAINVLKPFSYAPGQPFHNGADCLLIDGALYDDRPIDDLIQILFAGHSHELGTLNGQFNAVLFQKASNQLIIVTDRLGYRPLYYANNGQRHVISSEIKGIRAAVDRSFAISPIGLIELFAFGHNLADRTLLEGITVLPPGSVITIDLGGVRLATYHEYRYSHPDESLSPQEWGERISACLKQVAPKYLRGPARKGIFLSGGLDSRLVAGALGNTDTPVHAYTFGDPESRDVRFARQIASHMGFPHDMLSFPTNYLSKSIREVVARTECASTFYHATSIVFHEEIASATDSILVGFCGDVLSGGHLKRAMLKPSRSSDIGEQIFRRALCANRDNIAEVFQPHFFEKYWPDTVDAFHASVSVIDEGLGADVADVWDMHNRQRRFTFSAQKVDRPRFEIVAPLLDNAFVDLMASLPVSARWKQLAYRHAIVDGFPQLRKVPWTRTGRPVPRGRMSFWVGEGRRFGGKAFHLALSKLGLDGNLGKDKYKNVADDMRHDQRLFSDYLDRHLASRSLPPDIFNFSGISKLIESHKNGKDCSHLLGTVMTIAAYLES